MVEIKNQVCIKNRYAHSEKWIDLVEEACSDFNKKKIIFCQDPKIFNPIRKYGAIVADGNLVEMKVDGFYQDNSKWHEGMSFGLGPGTKKFEHNMEEPSILEGEIQSQIFYGS